jgi:hypothetical protein
MKAFPLGQLNFTWEALNQDFASHAKNFKDITTIANVYSEEEIDLRLCMIERPYAVSVFDKFPKILNLFRQMQLRQLLVTNDADGRLAGIITRKDFFSYMSL